jgi:molecular chaperone DnaK (HSP70)
MTEEPKYIIGFDLGDGESSIAITPVNGNDEPEVFEFEAGVKSLITAIAETENDQGKSEILIGEAAIVHPEAKRLSIRYKVDPYRAEDDWEINKHKILQFAEKFFSRLIAQKPHLRENIRVCIGHPSAWSEEGVKIYKDLFSNSSSRYSIPSTGIVAESRAAFIQARDYLNISDRDIQDSVLVIDIGSSTTDFTYRVAER